MNIPFQKQNNIPNYSPFSFTKHFSFFEKRFFKIKKFHISINNIICAKGTTLLAIFLPIVKVFAELMLHINSALNIPSQLPHPSVPAAPPSAHHPWGSSWMEKSW
jgi:hypothetical protein